MTKATLDALEQISRILTEAGWDHEDQGAGPEPGVHSGVVVGFDRESKGRVEVMLPNHGRHWTNLVSTQPGSVAVPSLDEEVLVIVDEHHHIYLLGTVVKDKRDLKPTSIQGSPA